MIAEYYIWTIDPRTGDCWHGLKPVSLERAITKIAQLQAKGDGQYYWYEPINVEPSSQQILSDIADAIEQTENDNWGFEGEYNHVLPEQYCQFCQPHEDELEIL